MDFQETHKIGNHLRTLWKIKLLSKDCYFSNVLHKQWQKEF